MSDAEGSTDVSDVGEVWIGEQSIAGDEFVEALDHVVDLQENVQEVREELESLSVGLDREDAERLVYARNHNLTLGQVEASFEVIDAFTDESIDEVAPRLMADRTGDLTISEAAAVWDDMVTLAKKYGSMNVQED